MSLLLLYIFFFLLIRRPPRSTRADTLFPYTTLVRSIDHLSCRELAEGFSRHWDEALECLTDGSLDTWLRRSLGDEERTEAVNQAKTVVSGFGTESDDRILARVCIALDPYGAIRYRDFRATIEGVGGFLGAFVDDEGARRLFSEVMRPTWCRSGWKIGRAHV